MIVEIETYQIRVFRFDRTFSIEKEGAKSCPSLISKLVGIPTYQIGILVFDRAFSIEKQSAQAVSYQTVFDSKTSGGIELARA